MTGIIIYNGKYGATAQYAEWLGKELNFPVLSSGNSDRLNLPDYNPLVMGTSIYIGKLQIASWLADNLPFIMNKKIFLFMVGGTSPDEKEKLEGYIRTGIPPEIRQNCDVFYLQGKMIKKNLSWKDRMLLKIGASLVKDPQERKKMLTDYDAVKKENLTGIITAIKIYSPKKEAAAVL